MFIDELPESKNIQISLISNEKIIQLESTIKKDISDKDIKYLNTICKKANVFHYIAINDIFRKGKQIGFYNKTLNYTIFITQNEKKLKFEYVKILRLFLPDSGSVNILFCNFEAKPVNKRQFYRVDVNESATCKINDAHYMHNVLLKDLSIHGMGFIMQEEHVLDEGDEIELRFFVPKNNDTIQFTLHGKVIHSSVMPDGKFLVGCFIPQTNNEFSKLVNRKQLENIKKKKCIK